jgi:flagellar motor switch protein FliM
MELTMDPRIITAASHLTEGKLCDFVTMPMNDETIRIVYKPTLHFVDVKLHRSSNQDVIDAQNFRLYLAMERLLGGKGTRA